MEVLDDIRAFLQLFHTVQQLMSFEKTPSLPYTLPAYEELLQLLELFKQVKPQLTHAADAAISKLHFYLEKTRDTPMYALAMGKFYLLS